MSAGRRRTVAGAAGAQHRAQSDHLIVQFLVQVVDLKCTSFGRRSAS